MANIKEKYIHGGDEKFDKCRRESIDMAIKALRQPQIVRCKDCKYWRKLLLNRNGDGACHADNSIRVSNQSWFCADGIAKDIITEKKDGEVNESDDYS